jgi:hypothetical protein
LDFRGNVLLGQPLIHCYSISQGEDPIPSISVFDIQARRFPQQLGPRSMLLLGKLIDIRQQVFLE